MIGFSQYLIESLDIDKLRHLEHAEDHIIHDGEESLKHVTDNLHDLHSFLTGSKSKLKIIRNNKHAII
jgi:hypothetical protein